MSTRGKVIRLPIRPAAPSAERGLVEVRRCDQAEAIVLKGLFESEGIPTLLRSRLAHSVYPFSVGDQGEVIVLVPASEAARAGVFSSASSPRRRPTPFRDNGLERPARQRERRRLQGAPAVARRVVRVERYGPTDQVAQRAAHRAEDELPQRLGLRRRHHREAVGRHAGGANARWSLPNIGMRPTTW